MRVLFVSANYSYFFTIDPVIRELYRRGHEIHLVTGMKEKRNFPNDAMENARVDLPGLVIHPLLKRKFLYGPTRNLRELLNYVNILNHETIRLWDVVLWGRFFPKWLWRLVNTPKMKAKLKDRAFQHILRALEQRIPVSMIILKNIRRIKPDVVLLLPLVNPDSRETEYMRAAQTLDIPTIYAMASWDNTSTKGTFHGFPDYSLVWNASLADELVNLHGYPRERIFTTGAPRFSHLFGDLKEQDILSRKAFSQLSGLDMNKPYVLYVCSTFLLNNNRKKELDESIIILEVARALEKNPRTKDVNILVRPHPLNMSYVSKLITAEQTNIFVYPINGEIPDTEEKMKRYNSSIYHAFAAMGVNTTAFLEVAALDRPCITLYIEEFTETQQLPHFHHLTDAGFLETANGSAEAAEIVARIIDGVDNRAKQRREFARNFLMPNDQSAVTFYSNVIEELAKKPKLMLDR